MQKWQIQRSSTWMTALPYILCDLMLLMRHNSVLPSTKTINTCFVYMFECACACDTHRMKRRLFSKKWLYHSNTERLWLKWLSIQFQSEANQSMDKCPKEMYYICWCNTLMERESFVNDVFAIILCVYFLSVSSVSHQSIGQFMVWIWKTH